jgi:hypothetical protein
MPCFLQAFELSRAHLVGPATDGPIAVRRAEPGDLLRPGDPLLLSGADLPGSYFYRGPANHEGRQVGFVLAHAGGGLLLLSDFAPAPGLEIAIGEKAERLIGLLPGTLIDTPEGERPVETLMAGDLVCRRAAAPEPVRRVSRRFTSAVFTDVLHAAPVRIGAGALGGGVPRRELAVSGDTALLLGGVLVQAGALVDGRAIRRDEAPDALTTHIQIELPAHALISVEGAVVESYCEVGRIAAGPQDLDDDEPAGDSFGAPEMDLPRARSHRQVPYAVRALLGV